MSLFGTAAQSASKNLVQFKAGKMNLKGTTVTADKRRGQVYVHQSEDSLIHFCWKDRKTGNVEDDLIIFPDDCELKPVPQCTTGRVFILKFKSSNRKMFFWMQEPKSDKDDEYCKKVNDALNNPPQPGQGQPSAADLGGLDALGQGGLQDLFSNMDQQQLLQLMAGGGLGNLLNPGRGSSQRSRNPTSRSSSAPRSDSAPRTESAPPSTTGTTTTTTAPVSAPTAAAAAPSSTQSQPPAVQLSQLQDILSQMGVPGQKPIDLSEAITPETMIPILADPKVQERLKPYLPQGETLKSTEEELRETVHSPSFRQAMGSFSSALASGQLGPLLKQFGLPEAAQTAASKGDVEAFAKAMQEDAKKPENEDDMSVD